MAILGEANLADLQIHCHRIEISPYQQMSIGLANLLLGPAEAQVFSARASKDCFQEICL